MAHINACKGLLMASHQWRPQLLVAHPHRPGRQWGHICVLGVRRKLTHTLYRDYMRYIPLFPTITTSKFGHDACCAVLHWRVVTKFF